jgi:hypothetical protein
MGARKTKIQKEKETQTVRFFLTNATQSFK